MGVAAAPARMDRADVRVDGQVNNLDAVVLFHWVLGATPVIPMRNMVGPPGPDPTDSPWPTPTPCPSPTPLPTSTPVAEITLLLPGDVSLVLVPISAGTFLMGAPYDELHRFDNEGPAHMVTLTHDFAMGKYVVTKAQWMAVMDTAPWADLWGVLDAPDSPAVFVSWSMITGEEGFLDRLNAHLIATGQTAAGMVRLPTEAQWEYASRAGTTTRYYWGNDPQYSLCGAYGWMGNNLEGDFAHVVGRKIPNAWGLYDMSGNVYEWCHDGYADYTAAPQIDPVGVNLDGTRVCRGGSYLYHPRYCRSAARNGYGSASLSNLCGFRVIAAFDPPPPLA